MERWEPPSSGTTLGAAGTRPASASLRRGGTASARVRPASAGFSRASSLHARNTSSRYPATSSRQRPSGTPGGSLLAGSGGRVPPRLLVGHQRSGGGGGGGGAGEMAVASARAEAAQVRHGFIASTRSGWPQSLTEPLRNTAATAAASTTPRSGANRSHAWPSSNAATHKSAGQQPSQPVGAGELEANEGSGSGSGSGTGGTRGSLSKGGAQVGTEGSTPAPAPLSSTTTSTAVASTPLSRDSIVIHVHDDRVGQSSDFTCSRSEIVQHMKYFERFLGDSAVQSCDPDDVDISVHCDISVFEWLVKYMRSPHTSAATLTVPSVVSILISSEFLQMAPLVSECLRFIHGHINQIVKLPIDFGCINASLMRRLAQKFNVDELDEVKDPRDKLLGRLYMNKLELFLENEMRDSELNQCINCGRLFTEQSELSYCQHAKMQINFHGVVVARHKPNPDWSRSGYILRLRSDGKSWREIFWHIWGISHVMTCTVCGDKFCCAELGHCSYHPQAVRHDSGNEGVYPCCGQRVLNFDVSNKSAVARRGCCARNHVVRAEGRDAMILETMLKRHSLVTIPFSDVKRLYETSTEDSETHTKAVHVSDDGGNSNET